VNPFSLLAGDIEAFVLLHETAPASRVSRHAHRYGRVFMSRTTKLYHARAFALMQVRKRIAEREFLAIDARAAPRPL
jgi:hypothetical protein